MAKVVVRTEYGFIESFDCDNKIMVTTKKLSQAHRFPTVQYAEEWIDLNREYIRGECISLLRPVPK